MAYGFNDDKSKYPFGGSVLWENSAPSSAFAAQTVSLSDSLANYEYIEIIFKRTNTDNVYGTTGKIPVSASGLVLNIGKFNQSNSGSTNVLTSSVYTREATIAGNTSIAFAVGSYMSISYGSSHSYSAGSSTTYCVPYKIIGHKG